MASAGIQKHSEQLRQAVRWVSEQRQDHPDIPLGRLLSEAGPRFNLSPKDQAGLIRLLRESDQPDRIG